MNGHEQWNARDAAADLELYAAAHTRALIKFHQAQQVLTAAGKEYELAKTELQNSKSNLFKAAHDG